MSRATPGKMVFGTGNSQKNMKETTMVKEICPKAALKLEKLT
jgi:hypothetical protein